MGSQGAGRRRLPQRERLTAEDDALSRIAREAEARLAAKRAARAEAREIRMKELERQQKEIYQVQKKYYGLDTKWGDIERWMEDSERYSRRSRRLASASDEDERLSVGSRGSLRSNGYDGESYGSQPASRRSGRNSSYSGDGRFSTLSSPREEKLPSCLCSVARPAGSYLASVFPESSVDLARRGSACGSMAQPAEHSSHLNSSSRASSRASSARASPVVEERPDKEFTEKGSRNMPSLSAATLASLGGTSSRRGSGDTSISIDTEASMREIKDSLAEVEEKYKKAMVSNAQLDNEKTNFMYQVDTLKDVLLELEEELAEARRQCEEKGKELERERHAHSVLQFQLAEVKEALRQRDEMLEEIRQLQQKQASSIREIADLQETIEWKDKKIGALERQKEFFDSIRSERDDLREEVAKLKVEFKKHGIILSSEAATNGEAADTLNSVGSPSPTKMTREEINALRSSGDGTLGRAKEVEVEKEIVENMGKKEISQNAEQEQHGEGAAPDGAGGEEPQPGDQPASGDVENAECKGRVQSQSPENPETAGQLGSQEVAALLAEETEASLGQPTCPKDFGRGAPDPMPGQDACSAADITEQGEESVRRQDQVDVEEIQGSAPMLEPKAGRVSGADPGGSGRGHSEKELEAGAAAVGAPGCHRGNRLADELDSSTGYSSEKDVPEQETAKPMEASTQSTGGREDGVEEGGAETKDEKPVQTEAQTIPEAPTAQNSQEEAPGPGRTEVDHEPSEGKSNHQAEASESSQKKSKNKKKKNKKKKSSAPVESLEDVRKELTYQNADGGEVQEEQGLCADQTPVAEAQEEVTEEARHNSVAGSGSGDCAGFPEAELDGKLDQEEEDMKPEDGNGKAARDTRDGPGRTTQPAEGVSKGCRAGTAGVAPGVELTGGTRSSLQLSAGPTADVCETGSPEWPETSQQQSQLVLEATDSVSLEKGDFSIPPGEPGDLGSESRGHGKEGSEKGKGKEDCTMS
ncbi:leucine-rich repeat flightless-interacting protein 1 isoform X7 [Octodon degus]|uniref:Leucine-rich repeat flightless-interacting protein 1 isoform X7 n=1 Tax=Octodon degus TaxID=10160 RepID=A0A6P6F0F6_OCTDE|nr:leucine-rich repeat flightless-interacting protein 1 isoform X7 [Octodon degus]